MVENKEIAIETLKVRKRTMLVMITWQLHIQSQLAFFMLVTNLNTWKWSPMNEFVLKS
jgi:hypothetical protein